MVDCSLCDGSIRGKGFSDGIRLFCGPCFVRFRPHSRLCVEVEDLKRRVRELEGKLNAQRLLRLR